MARRKKIKHGNLSRQVYEFIKRRIFIGEYKPGHSLLESKMADTLKLSRTPVREALQRLAHERLVRLVPGKGAFVTNVSLRRLRDIFEVRELVEPKAAEKAASDISRDALSVIKNKLLSVRLDEHSNLIYVTEVWEELHKLILSQAGNEIFMEIILNLTAELRAACSTTFKEQQNVRKFHQQHIEICKALSERNSTKAKQKMREHILSVRESLIGQISA